MFSSILSAILALEKLIPLLTRGIDLAIAARAATQKRADERALADQQSAKDARNAAAIANANK